MLPPHPLDEVFLVPDSFGQEMIASDLFKEAISAAQAAFLETRRHIAANPRMVGGGPNQMARVAFLNVLNQREI